MQAKLGDTLRLLRLQRGLTIEALATAAGISVTAIEFYEANVWRPGRATLHKLATVLAVTAAELQEGCELLYAENGDLLVVAHLGPQQIRVVGRISAVTARPAVSG